MILNNKYLNIFESYLTVNDIKLECGCGIIEDRKLYMMLSKLDNKYIFVDIEEHRKQCYNLNDKFKNHIHKYKLITYNLTYDNWNGEYIRSVLKYCRCGINEKFKIYSLKKGI